MLPRLATAMLILSFAASAAEAQTASQPAVQPPPQTTQTAATLLSINGSSAVKPMIGAGLYQKRSKEFGYYLNGGVSVADTAPYYDSLYPGAFGDQITDRFGLGYFVNVGASLPVGSLFTVYGGVGLAGVAGIAQQHETTPTLSSDGTYYVPDPSGDSVGANYNAGVLVSAGKVVFEAGYNTYFETGYVGIGFGF